MKMKLLLSLSLILASISLFAQQPPDSPVLTKPPKLSIIEPVNTDFQWETDPYAVSYTLQIATDYDFQNLVVSIKGIVDTEYQLQEGILQPNTSYYWRVIASNQYGYVYSRVSSFMTAGTTTQDITQLMGRVDYLVSFNLLNSQQGIMLNNRLQTAITQLSNNHRLLAICQMVSFNVRVWILINSNLLSEEDGQPLIDYSFMVINYIWNGNAPAPITSIADNTFSLKQNYPNPFNPSTTIEYTVPVNTHVTLKIYDILGKEVATLVDRDQNNGSYILIWNASNLSSGVYFYKLVAGNNVQTKRMLLSK
jgi:hypothetical protein